PPRGPAPGPRPRFRVLPGFFENGGVRGSRGAPAGAVGLWAAAFSPSTTPQRARARAGGKLRSTRATSRGHPAQPPERREGGEEASAAAREPPPAPAASMPAASVGRHGACDVLHGPGSVFA